MKEWTFEEFCNALLYHRITAWKDNRILLDNGLELSIEETDQDCCASAVGCFSNVVLDAAITHVEDIKYEPWEDGDTFGCVATVNIMHNQNLICQAMANANAGNGGYYYSVASFVVRTKGKVVGITEFVHSSN